MSVFKFRKFFISIFIVGSLGLFIFCSPSSKRKGDTVRFAREKTDSSYHKMKDVEIKYAQGFSISTKNGYKEVTVFNPRSKNEVFYKYCLVDRGKKIPKDLLNGFVVEVPVRSVAALSSAQIGILSLLDESDKITAVSLSDKVYDTALVRRVNAGKIEGVGDVVSLNFERLVDVSPELIIMSGYMSVSERENRLLEAGLPVVFSIDWMEQTPLAKAEWIKFSAAFFDKDAEAERIFNDMEKRYLDLVKLTADVTQFPDVLSGCNFKGTWYMPGGNSYMAKFFSDAKSNYCWSDDTTRGSIPLSFEVVFDRQKDADVWFVPAQSGNLENLKGMDARYALFKPVKTGRVFSYTKRVNEQGANDWWETSVIQPDIVLKDFIRILHPELLPDYDLYYYKRL